MIDEGRGAGSNLAPDLYGGLRKKRETACTTSHVWRVVQPVEYRLGYPDIGGNIVAQLVHCCASTRDSWSLSGRLVVNDWDFARPAAISF